MRIFESICFRKLNEKVYHLLFYLFQGSRKLAYFDMDDYVTCVKTKKKVCHTLLYGVQKFFQVSFLFKTWHYKNFVLRLTINLDCMRKMSIIFIFTCFLLQPFRMYHILLLRRMCEIVLDSAIPIQTTNPIFIFLRIPNVLSFIFSKIWWKYAIFFSHFYAK